MSEEEDLYTYQDKARNILGSSINKQTMTNTSSYLWGIYFKLNYECTFEDILVPTDIKLEMKVHEDGKTKIVCGFEVQVNSPTEEIAKDCGKASKETCRHLCDIIYYTS
jgi:hypothetical protein